jgi:hypothetical protein
MTEQQPLPRPTRLYRHFAADGSLLYVGISLSWPARTRSHAHYSAWFAQVATVQIESFPDRESALNAEREAIRSERPKFNVVHNREVATPRKQDRSQKPARSTGASRIGNIKGPHAIVGPALVYRGNTISVVVAHGRFGTEGDLTELVLGELFPDLPEWTDAVETVLTIRRPDELTLAEAGDRRREIIDTLTADLEVVQSFQTDIAMAAAYATQFPSAKSRQLLDAVASEVRR